MPVIPTYEAHEELDPDARGMPRAEVSQASAQASGMVARAIQGLGSELSSVGSSIGAHLQQQQQQAATFATGLQNRALNSDLENSFQDSVKNISPNGFGFSQSFMDNANKLAAQRFAQMPDGPAKTQAMQTWETVTQHDWLHRAATQEYQQSGAYSAQNINNMATVDQQTVQQNPASMDALLKQGEQQIMNAPGLTTQQKMAMLQDYTRQVRTTGLEAAHGTDPDAMRQAVGMPAGTPGGSAGDYLTRLAQVESGGDPNAQASSSSAKGLYQFTASTWDSLRREYPQLGLTADGRSDPAQQQKAAIAFTNENASALGRAGFQATPGNLYAAHFAGSAGAVAALKADPGKPISDVLGQSVVNANPFLKGKTAGQFLDWASSKMGGASVAHQDGLTFTDKQRLVATAEAGQQRQQAQIQQQNKLESFNVGNKVNDDLASVEATGKGVEDLTPDRVAAVLGPQKAQEWQDGRQRALGVYTATAGMDQLPNDQIAARLQSIAPKVEDAGPGYVNKAMVFDAAQKKAAAIMKQRADDPASVADAAPAVLAVKARASQNDATSLRAVVQARIAQQASLGIPEGQRQPITKAEAQQIIEPVNNAPSGMDGPAMKQAIDRIETMVGPQYAPQALQFMLNQGKVDNDTAKMLSALLIKAQKGMPVTQTDIETLNNVNAGAALRNSVFMGGDSGRRGIGSDAIYAPPEAAPALPQQPTAGDPPTASAQPPATAQGQRIVPSDSAIAALVQNPSKAADFDEMFGKGSAAKVLGKWHTMTGAPPRG